MLRNSLAILALGLSTPAFAADHELSLELGSLHVNSDSWDLFHEGEYFPTAGVRLGVAVHERVAVVAGYHHAAYGSDIYTDSWSGEYDFADEESDAADFVGAFAGDEYTLGAKVDVPVTGWLHPYGVVHALGVRGVIRLDEDVEDDDNLNQLPYRALTFGGMGALGVEFLAPVLKEKAHLGSYLELGYGRVAALDFDALGKMPMGGFAVRMGTGVRF